MSERGVKLTLLSRASCHLCDEMLADVRPVVEAHGAALEVLDVDAPGNAALESVWGDRVPALFAGTPDSGALLCHYHLDRARLLFALRAPPAVG